MKNKIKKYLVTVLENATNGVIYSDSFRSLWTAHHTATRFRAIYGCDNVVITNTTTGEVIEGL